MKSVDVRLNRLAAGQYPLAHRTQALEFTWRDLCHRPADVVDCVAGQLVLACPA